MQKTLLPIFSTLSIVHFTSSALIHHDEKATSYQHIEIEHFHPVPTYIKQEDIELLLKNPVFLGKTQTNLEVDHKKVEYLKHKPVEFDQNYLKQTFHAEIPENEIINQNNKNTMFKHHVYPSFQGDKSQSLGLGAYSSGESEKNYQYDVYEDQEEGGISEEAQKYIEPHQKNEDDYKLTFSYAPNQNEDLEGDGDIAEGTPEYVAYQKLAQAALLEYEKQIDPAYQHHRHERTKAI